MALKQLTINLILGILSAVLLSASLITIRVPVATAASCYTIQTHLICLISIQRSAKNYWEYRVKLSVDGVIQPLEIYNCRDRLRISKRNSIAFTTNGIGEKVCALFK